MMERMRIGYVLLLAVALTGCAAVSLPPEPRGGKPLPITVGVLESSADDGVLLEAFKNTGLFMDAAMFRPVSSLPDVLVEIETEMTGRPADPLCQQDCAIIYSSTVSFRKPLSAEKEFIEYSYESVTRRGLSGAFLSLSRGWAQDFDKERYYRQVAFKVYSKVSAEN